MGALRLNMSLSGGSMDAALAALAARLDELSGPLDAFGKTMMDSVRRNFDEQGRPDGWEPLAASTARRKGNGAILVDTGRLRGSIGFRAGHDRLTLYSALPYASVHQRGGAAGRGGSAVIPARPYLVFQEDDIARLRDILLRHLLSGS